VGKKKPSTRKAARKRRASSTPQPERTVPPVDPRASERVLSDIGRLLSDREFASKEELNAFLQQIVASGEVPAPKPRSPLDQAQDLIYDAWESSGERSVELARRALEISPDCADAYLLLAEETAETLEKARNLYEQAVKAGERALGPEKFKEYAGHFWGFVKTRPYMRARAALAECLWMLGERRQAIEHCTEMLRLNPGDNQGMRHILVNYVLEEGDDEAAERLLDEYEGEDTATWLYSRALSEFRREGASREARLRLKEAVAYNPFVPRYILGKKKLPTHLPELIGRGDEDEAIAYTSRAIKVWRKTPGAREWLAGSVTGRGA